MSPDVFQLVPTVLCKFPFVPDCVYIYKHIDDYNTEHLHMPHRFKYIILTFSSVVHLYVCKDRNKI
jgi:hypothetical protein